MQAQLERQMTAFREEVAAEANRIGGVIHVTGRRVVPAEKRQAKLEADLATLGKESGRLLLRNKRLGMGILLGSVLLSGTFISLALRGGTALAPVITSALTGSTMIGCLDHDAIRYRRARPAAVERGGLMNAIHEL